MSRDFKLSYSTFETITDVNVVLEEAFAPPSSLKVEPSMLRLVASSFLDLPCLDPSVRAFLVGRSTTLLDLPFLALSLFYAIDSQFVVPGMNSLIKALDASLMKPLKIALKA